jgi:hypothetical protein
MTLGLPELRSHRHWRALLTLLTALFSDFGGFQSWITTNEDGGNRADGASNESEDASFFSTSPMKSDLT